MKFLYFKLKKEIYIRILKALSFSDFILTPCIRFISFTDQWLKPFEFFFLSSLSRYFTQKEHKMAVFREQLMKREHETLNNILGVGGKRFFDRKKKIKYENFYYKMYDLKKMKRNRHYPTTKEI